MKSDLDPNNHASEKESICFIVNPMAGRQKVDNLHRLMEAKCSTYFKHWTVRETEHQGHGTQLAREAMINGFDIICAVGGDGTCHEVINGFHPKETHRKPAIFATIPFGTGCDLAKSIGMPKSVSSSIWIIASGMTLMTDLCFAKLDNNAEEAFINVAGTGLNGEVVHRANENSKALGGRLSFLRATLEVGVPYQARPIHVRWEDKTKTSTFEGLATSVFMANGRFCGGGMVVAPVNSIRSGALHLTILPPAPLFTQLKELRLMYSGDIHKVTGAKTSTCSRIVLKTMDQRALTFDLDGEFREANIAKLRIKPKFLAVRGNW